MSLAWVQLCCMLCFSLSSCSSMITHVSVKSTSWAVCFCSDKIGELFGYHSLLGWWSVTAFIFKFRSHLQCWVSYPVMCFWLKPTNMYACEQDIPDEGLLQNLLKFKKVHCFKIWIFYVQCTGDSDLRAPKQPKQLLLLDLLPRICWFPPCDSWKNPASSLSIPFFWF